MSDPFAEGARDTSQQTEDDAPEGLAALLQYVACGDRRAFELVYEQVSGPVYGTILRVVRDPAQTEEVAQETLVQVWREASRFDPLRGSPMAWILTLAHRRAVDRVRSVQAGSAREQRAGYVEREHDHVVEEVETRLDRERVRRCLGGLTGLQRESLTLAYYSGYTYPEVAGLLNVPLGTVKTRMRDALIRMRDCLGVDR
ncbi:ECF RNA polymerase sigma factor SigK [Actinocorallia populi]|uniref:ECF RNA polymerase sigma factor SigK n=1 Tax=Actinocorallia populi TaxID=2079200 RepID=UPI000D0944FA|nr:ECF RNA polymerase sigma factor SigK [Actinocorallia populi]